MTWKPTDPALIPEPEDILALFPDNDTNAIRAKSSRDMVQAVLSSIAVVGWNTGAAVKKADANEVKLNALSTGVTIKYSVATLADLPKQGMIDGDGAIVEADGTLHVWHTGLWTKTHSTLEPRLADVERKEGEDRTNLSALSHRVDYQTEVDEAVFGTVLPWDGTGTYAVDDVVLDAGKAYRARVPVPAGTAAPHATPTYPGPYGDKLPFWAILDVAGDDEIVAALIAGVGPFDPKKAYTAGERFYHEGYIREVSADHAATPDPKNIVSQPVGLVDAALRGRNAAQGLIFPNGGILRPHRNKPLKYALKAGDTWVEGDPTWGYLRYVMSVKHAHAKGTTLPDRWDTSGQAPKLAADFDQTYRLISVTENMKRLDMMQEVNGAVLGDVHPWDAKTPYVAGDLVLDAGKVYLALHPVAASTTHPVAGTDWAILDYVSQYGTMVDIELKAHDTRAILDGMLTYGGTVKPWDAATDYKTPTSVTHRGMVWYTHAAVVPGGKPPGDHGSPWLPINAINTQAELEDVMNRAFALSGHANHWVAKKPYAKGDTAVVVDDAHHTAQIWRATKAIAAHSPTPAAPDWREVDVAALDDTIQSLTARIDAIEAFDKSLMMGFSPVPWTATGLPPHTVVVSHKGHLYTGGMMDKPPAASDEPGKKGSEWMLLALPIIAAEAAESVKQMNAMFGGYINTWYEHPFTKGSVAIHNGAIYVASAATTKTDEPGVAAVWVEQSLMLLDGRIVTLEAKP